MSLLGVIALVFGILGVILTIFQKIWCWPAALISVVVSVFVFYKQRLFGDMTLQVFYFVAGVYGWWYWEKNSNAKFKVGHVPKKMWAILIIATLLQFGLYFLLLTKFKGDRIIFDSILTAASITATYMMTKKWIENWICWVLIDFAYVFLYGLKHMWDFAILNIAFTLMAAYGFYLWKKKA